MPFTSIDTNNRKSIILNMNDGAFTNCIIAKGTKYHVENPDGTLSAERVASEDTFAKLMGFGETYNVYVVDGDWWYIPAAEDK